MIESYGTWKITADVGVSNVDDTDYGGPEDIAPMFVRFDRQVSFVNGKLKSGSTNIVFNAVSKNEEVSSITIKFGLITKFSKSILEQASRLSN